MSPVRFGSGEFQYELVEGWPQLPEDWVLREVGAVAVDSADRVFIYHRGAHPVIVFAPDGSLAGQWGDGMFGEPHGMFIDGADHVYLVDRGAHTTTKHDPDGTLLMTIGTKWQPAPKQGNRPFNLPAGICVSANGEIYIADGYGNSAIHHFAPDGNLLSSFGAEGEGPGQFHLPHGVWVLAGGEVLVCDRENNRIQFFSPEGQYLDEWHDLNRPAHAYVGGDGTIYVAELDNRVSILSPDGAVLCRWGGEASREPGLFIGAHGICIDSCGDLYVSEVLGGRRVQKFRRV